MASGSQTYSGTCADFPVAPMNSRMQTTVRTPKVPSGSKAVGFRLVENSLEIDAAERPEDEHDSQGESEIANTIDDECLLAGIGGALLAEVETDEQIGTEPDAFPTHKHQEEIVGENQHQHREHEEIQISEETVVALFMRHVASGVNVDEKADSGDDENHHAGQLVEHEAEIGDEVSRLDPAKIVEAQLVDLFDRCLEELRESQQRETRTTGPSTHTPSR